VALGLTSFQKTLTPYLAFDDARQARGVVQVMGGLDKTSDRYDTATERLFFDLVDEKGGRMPVVYGGTRPANFRDAISIVAIGRYRDGRIEAEKLLVKCPSKYQGAEVEKAYSSKPASGT
jgi:cytochrome c-type biogenesis protein CcmE